jgi:FtsZ-interacting cell division protein ZipA
VAAELRWILLGLSLPLLAGIWWWTARRAGQVPGNSEFRESAPSVDPPRHAASGDDLPPEPAPQLRDWGVPPFEPLNIHTADFDHVPVLDGPMMVGAEPAAIPGSVRATAPTQAPAPTPPPSVRPTFTTGPVSEHSDRAAAAAPQVPNAAEMQRIVTIRVCAVGETRWSGGQLMAALELHGLAFGRYQVFHRKHTDGRSLFCVASLIEPGTFDVAEMADQEYRGVTLFAVLPGPLQPLETMDELLGTARGLAEELSGVVQDAKGMPLSPLRTAALREDIASFQASLPGN